jgi:hypothetical protein
MTERTYTPPAGVVSSLVGSCVTLDELERVEFRDDALGIWAHRTALGARRSVMNQYLSDDPVLPVGLVASLEDELDVVVGLRRGDEHWGLAASGDDLEELTLTESEVAFVLRHLDSPVVLHPARPVAWMTPIGITAAVAEMPPDSLAYAVLDEIDKSAVLELIAVSKGPKIIRRINGEWHDDPTWASILRSPRPPKVVALRDEQLNQVLAQVDESTKGDKFEPTIAAKFVHTSLASAYEAADQSTATLLPLLAKGEIMVPVEDLVGSMPPKLKKYWTAGAGAAKIAWGTPGAWRRCHRYLSKYLGPSQVAGACTNLGKLRGGKGVAWDV